jgi:hypothetical protein
VRHALKINLAILISTVGMLLFSKPSLAVVNPLSVPNNTYGIHILSENDLQDAANLVNSSGGDWGYVTIVIRKDERNLARWNKMFRKMENMHLIPIVRIATSMTPHGWEKFEPDDIDNWVFFLNSLNWFTKNRYVAIGNEPNHAKEWGGEVNPAEYGQILFKFSEKLKSASDDFFILPAGLDASAPSDKLHMDQEEFLRKMISQNPDVFKHTDGWNSHSYPNPNFSGSSESRGRGTVRTFEWELNLLKSLGITKDFPVFITETGWIHNMDGKIPGLLDQETVGRLLKRSFETAWKNDKIAAVTPFLLNYNSAPFNIFSWTKPEGGLYDFYYQIQDLPKIKGEPILNHRGVVLSAKVPEQISNEAYKGFVNLKNTGSTVWKKENTFLHMNSSYVDIPPTTLQENLSPNEETIVLISGSIKNTVSESTNDTITISLTTNNVILDSVQKNLEILIPEPEETTLSSGKLNKFAALKEFLSRIAAILFSIDEISASI